MMQPFVTAVTAPRADGGCSVRLVMHDLAP